VNKRSDHDNRSTLNPKVNLQMIANIFYLNILEGVGLVMLKIRLMC